MEQRAATALCHAVESLSRSASSPEEQVLRVYAAGQRGPGLGVTRALGDAAAKSCGIIATPQAWQGFSGRVHILAYVQKVQHLRLDKHKEAPRDMCHGVTRCGCGVDACPHTCSTARG